MCGLIVVFINSLSSLYCKHYRTKVYFAILCINKVIIIIYYCHYYFYLYGIGLVAVSGKVFIGSTQ